jgi:uncharacterized protein YkwD
VRASAPPPQPVEVAKVTPAPDPVLLRQSAAAAVLALALISEISQTYPDLRHDPVLNRVAEAAAWTASVDEAISESAVRNEMVNALRSGVSPHVLTAWIRPPADAVPSAARAGVESALDVTADQLQFMYDRLAADLSELASAVALESFGVSVRRGPGGWVAALVALEPPRLPLRVVHRGNQALVTTPWNGSAAPIAFIVTARGSERLRASVLDHSATIVVPCRAGVADLEVTDSTGMFVSVVDVCNIDDPRWSSLSAVGPVDGSLVEFEQRAFEFLNRERMRNGLTVLIWDATAREMARRHSFDMAAHQLVSHVGFDGTTLQQRVDRVGLPARRAFENVGRAGGPVEMHAGFMTSPGHRDNVLEPSARHGAVGAARDPGTGELYFTQVLYEPLPSAER